MCRASDSFLPSYSTASPQPLRIGSVYVRFPGGHRGQRFPESLTLVYLPRISEAGLEIDGTKVRPDVPAFVTLHRVRDDDGVSYGCRDKVRAGAGLRFEVYLGEEKILKGTFRKEGSAGKGWKVECRCAMERESAVREGDVVEVLVGVEGVGGGGRDGIRETVRMAARRSRRGEGNGFRNGLEEIPEDGEAEGECYEDTSSGEQCSCCGGSDGCGEEGDEDEDEDEEEDYEAGEDWDEVNTEGVKWAVDVGIWVLCLGVGLLVTRASSKKLRRRRRLI
ncbi:hypothetical protein MLD38_037455 [Melastoma candidum]|uniref:Uncharacterized protein n=1 Tax=Melastoma candidum TaxID=119954 RepID=A0ACB9LNC8_9MYRT|nr:hypothetical protein MLD38_037455 [Melastoma candidum]